jgi:hypothetical protein
MAQTITFFFDRKTWIFEKKARNFAPETTTPNETKY